MTDGGDVNASVSATSTAGQEMLHRELPALTTYLQEEKVAVNAIVIHPVATAGGEPQSSTTDTGGESGGLMQQRDQQGGQRQEDVVKTATGRVNEAVIHSNSNGMSDDGSLSSATNAAGGSWLSVRA
jgi:hypothetical protein